MKKKLLIVTTNSALLKWKSLKKKLSNITKALNRCQNGEFEVSVIYQDAKPIVNANGYIDHTWFHSFSYPHFREGYHHVALHFSQERWQQFGIKGLLRGANLIDIDFVGDMYFRANENTLRNGKNQFEQVLLHEMSHELARSTGVLDKTHEFHAKSADISAIFDSYDLNKWQPSYQAGMKEITRLQAILETLLGQKRYINPLPFHFFTPSQNYGVKNEKWYPLTSHHIGTDFATLIGTPVLAPADCTVTRVGTLDKSLGNWAEVKVDNWYMILCHLDSVPFLGTRKAGKVIGFTGNTGFTTGTHLHMEGWYNEMDRSKLNTETWNKLTFDVTKKIII